MRRIVACTMVLTAASVIGFGGGAGAAPKTPLHCHVVPGDCVTKTTPCALPKPEGNAQLGHLQGGGNPCTPKTTKVCGPSKKVCDN
jgi:hypothetical protein